MCLCGYVHDNKLVLSPWSHLLCATPTPVALTVTLLSFFVCVHIHERVPVYDFDL